MKYLIIFIVLAVLAACSPLAYKDDVGFLNSAQANSMEYLAKVNGKACKDLDGLVGLCAKRISNAEDINFSFDARPYSYRLNVKCTKELQFELSVDVLENKAFTFKIPKEKFSDLLSFTCIGEVFPDDREGQVSASFQVRFIVFDSQYRAREQIYFEGSNIVLGEHSKYAQVDGKSYKEKTFVKLKTKPRMAYSESAMMRFNYYGY